MTGADDAPRMCETVITQNEDFDSSTDGWGCRGHADVAVPGLLRDPPRPTYLVEICFAMSCNDVLPAILQDLLTRRHLF